MIEAFVGGFIQVLSWPTFGLLLVGIVIGSVFGILPAVGGVVTLALLIPFTYEMEPISAFAFLLSAATVASTTGDLTSILFGIPGDSTSAALVVDGYPMSKKGQARRALAANLLSSLGGACIGAFAIVAAIPIMYPLVRSFGSPEFLMLTVLGVVYVGTLSSGALLKGLTAAAVGMLLATVGLDPQLSVPRYTFGLAELWDGVGLIPVTLGLFAFPELYELSVSRPSIAGTAAQELSGIREGVRDFIRLRWLVVRCSLIGTGVGIIPGLGTPVSQWMAYAHSVSSSKGRERFGHGAVEGVVGPGAANNSGLGGSLIPLVTFGIPGSLITAVLLGAFYVQGIVPGPSMLDRHLVLTMSFVATIVVANVIVIGLCFLLLGQLAKLTYVRSALIVPITTLFVLIGAFASDNSLASIAVMLLFGLIGVLLVMHGWPRAPLIVGLVLGELTERYLALSYQRHGFEFLTRPIVVILILFIVAPIVVRLVLGWRRRDLARGGDEPAERAPSAPEGGRPRLRPNGDLLLSVAILVLGGLALLDARALPARAAIMPTAAGVIVVGLAAATVVARLLGTAADASRRTAGQMDLSFFTRSGHLKFAAWIGGCTVLVWLVGFTLATPVLSVAYTRFVGKERWIATAIVASSATVTVWMLDAMLHVPFPPGRLQLLFA